MRNSKPSHSRRLSDKPKKDLRVKNPDQAVLDLLSKSSADLTRPRAISFYLYLPSRSSALEARGELKGLGFSVECTKAVSSTSWLCLATKDIVPRVGELTSFRITFELLARKFGGDYDGWETALDAEESRGLPNSK